VRLLPLLWIKKFMLDQALIMFVLLGSFAYAAALKFKAGALWQGASLTGMAGFLLFAFLL
jgi:hypothetical protein